MVKKPRNLGKPVFKRVFATAAFKIEPGEKVSYGVL